MTMGQLLPVGLTTGFMLLAGASPAPGQAQSADQDERSIKEVITRAYVNGLQKNGSRDDIRAGFHPSFVMKVLGDGGAITNVAIEDWIQRLPPEGNSPDHEVTHRIPTVLRTGDGAVAEVELYYDGRHVFTDYMSLYRFDQGWRIVAKIFYRHAST